MLKAGGLACGLLLYNHSIEGVGVGVWPLIIILLKAGGLACGLLLYNHYIEGACGLLRSSDEEQACRQLAAATMQTLNQVPRAS